MPSSYCRACNGVINASIRRWVDGGDRDCTIREFAEEIGVPYGDAFLQRVLRARKQ